MNTIFCIPYAGGAASAYGQLKEEAKQRNIELVLLELSGHSSRVMEPLYKDFAEATDDCCSMIKEYLNSHYVERYSIFGHSMGSWLTYEVVDKLKKDPSIQLPDKLFISGNRAPQISEKVKTGHMTDDEFWDWLYEQGGLEKELYMMNEFKEYFLPIIRNDYRILDEYAGENVPEKELPTDIYVMCGTDDDISISELNMWQRFTNRHFEVKLFEGDHFYFRKKSEEIVQYFYSSLKVM